jgi:Flp pilus assembly protein TadB
LRDTLADLPPQSDRQAEQLAEQFARTAADLRTLGEELGAIAHSEPKMVSLRRARFTFLVAVAVAALVGWLVWAHWHSLLAAFAPLIWVAGHGFRLRRTGRRTGPGTRPPGEDTAG